MGSVPLYVFMPVGSVKNFEGEPTPSATFWAMMNGAGDAAFALTAWKAFHCKSCCQRKEYLDIMTIYSVMHMGSFLYNHLYNECHNKKNPLGPTINYTISTVIPLFVWWHYRGRKLILG